MKKNKFRTNCFGSLLILHLSFFKYTEIATVILATALIADEHWSFSSIRQMAHTRTLSNAWFLRRIGSPESPSPEMVIQYYVCVNFQLFLFFPLINTLTHYATCLGIPHIYHWLQCWRCGRIKRKFLALVHTPKLGLWEIWSLDIELYL